MIPISLYTGFNQRPSDLLTKKEPYKKYFIICEGANTETFYFTNLIDNKRELGFRSTVDIILMEKTGEHKNLSYAKSLVKFAKDKRNELIEKEIFNAETDVIIVIFDLDIFNAKVKDIDELFKEEDDHLIFGFTNPEFGLFLLLHIKNSYNQIIKPNEEIILNNQKIGNKRPCEYYLWQQTNMNSKKNPLIGDLSKELLMTIEQEKYLNQDKEMCLEKISSNIGQILEKIIRDER